MLSSMYSFTVLALVTGFITQLFQVIGSESWSQVLEAHGLVANSTEQSMEATLSALIYGQRSLTLQEGRSRGGTVEMESEGLNARNRAVVGDEAESRTGTEDGVHSGGQLRVRVNLLVVGNPLLEFFFKASAR